MKPLGRGTNPLNAGKITDIINQLELDSQPAKEKLAVLQHRVLDRLSLTNEDRKDLKEINKMSDHRNVSLAMLRLRNRQPVRQSAAQRERAKWRQKR